MVFGGTNGYIIVNILSQGAVIFFFKCPQFTRVNDERRHFLLLAIPSYLLKLCRQKSVAGLNFIQVFFFVFCFLCLFFVFCFLFFSFCLFCFCFCFCFVLHDYYDINHVNNYFLCVCRPLRKGVLHSPTFP